MSWFGVDAERIVHSPASLGQLVPELVDVSLADLEDKPPQEIVCRQLRISKPLGTEERALLTVTSIAFKEKKEGYIVKLELKAVEPTTEVEVVPQSRTEFEFNPQLHRYVRSLDEGWKDPSFIGRGQGEATKSSFFVIKNSSTVGSATVSPQL